MGGRRIARTLARTRMDTAGSSGAGPRKPSLRPSVQDFDRRVEDVAGAAFGLDVFGLRRIRLDLATQPQDLDVDRAIVDFRVVQARKIEELFARKHPLRRRAERLQQAEFAVAQLDALAAGSGQPARAQIQFPSGESIRAPFFIARGQHLARGLVTAEDRAHACEQLARAERLGEVVVGAELERPSRGRPHPSGRSR